MSRASPFPGMDPWLEDSWGDVGARLATYARDALQTRLPKGLRSRIEEYVGIAVFDSSLDSQLCRAHSSDADALVDDHGSLAGAIASFESGSIVLQREVEPPTLRRVQIIDTQNGNRVVTSIEFLSPANKIGRGLELYRKKQREMIEGKVNLVEVDLVRTGDWAVAVDIGHVPVKLRGIYRAAVVRATRSDQCEYYAIPLTAPLPKLKIPLRPTDADVVLELQPLLEAAYTNGGYADDIDYKKSPLLPLPKIVAEWTSTWLKQHPDA